MPSNPVPVNIAEYRELDRLLRLASRLQAKMRTIELKPAPRKPAAVNSAAKMSGSPSVPSKSRPSQ